MTDNQNIKDICNLPCKCCEDKPLAMWQLPEHLKLKYASPICLSGQYDSCNYWQKKGSPIKFAYSNDFDRVNSCCLTSDNSQPCCQNKGVYSCYRGRCTGYDEFYQQYYPVYGNHTPYIPDCKPKCI